MNKKKLINIFKKITIPRGYKLHIRNKKSISIFNKFNIKQKIGFKPDGVWSSGIYNENSWIDYCIRDDVFLDIDPNILNFYCLKFDKDLILKLDTIKKIKDFTNKYRVGGQIDWRKVKKDGYCGVNFSKYIHNKFSPYDYCGWYETLDCACQCIWDSRAIIDIKLLNI